MSINIIKLPSTNNILTGSAAPLVVTRDMIRNFGAPEDYVEMHLSDPSGKIIYSIVPFTNYKIPGVFQPSVDPVTIQELTFDPEQDLRNLNILFGDYRITYNVLRPVIVKNFNPGLFIKEISGDRTEIRLATSNISNDDIITNTDEFIRNFQSTPYFKEFYLNFGKNQLIPAVNIALDLGPSQVTVSRSGVGSSVLSSAPTVLIKLLNPLPVKYRVNDLLTVVDEIANPQIFEAAITPDTIPAVFPTLRGPNFDLDLDNLRVGPTPYYNFNQITTFSGAFAPQLQQLLGQLSASNFSINIDYANFDYTDWVHFSSAARRLEGFQYKLTNIETYTEASASASVSTSPTALLDAQNYQNSINKTIQSFDDWEQYMFYETGTYAWPKQNSTKPYINYSVTASEAITWYSGSYASASLYDDNNQNYLLYAMPGYITENTDNELAFKFVASIGQMFDDIWIHIKAITDLYKAKNSLTQGISKDLVYFALQSMGIDVYTDEDGTNVFRYLYGVDENGNYLPNTGSYDTLVTASQYQIPGQDQQKGIYKRLYHNLPLLLKSKGTTRFIQYLNTIFGIPDTVMSYLEYGGVDKVTSSFEYEFDKFNYALNVSGSNTVSIPWVYTNQSTVRTTYSDIVPNGIEFRFKASPSYSLTQSLFYNGSNYSLNVLYTSTGSNDSIYSGTVGDFGYLEFKLGSSTITTPTVPVFYTGSNTDSDNTTDWYTVLVQRRNPDLRIGQVGTSQTYDVYIKNNVWGEIGHVASASLTTSTQNTPWYTSGTTLTFGGGTYPFSGSIQEVRLWSNYLSESAFNSHVLNPESIEGNFTTSSFADLAARFALGNNLYTYNHSVTTDVASVAPDQTIQAWTASFANFPNQNNYSSFTETYYADVANSGYANPVTDKVRIVSGSEYGTQLLPNKSIELQPLIPLTKDIHLLDASLSPQDEIDRAIIAQFGSTYNLDDIIGNPETGSYDQLQTLQFDFFRKFTSKYDYKDYIRLISFFHNSLFRTLKDFTPARTNLAAGIVIKPHLLERPVINRPGPYVTYQEETGSIDTAFISASNGGDYSQSLYPITIQGRMGDVSFTSDARDFFTGELPSSSLEVVVTQSNPFTVFNPTNTSSYSESIWYHDYYPLINNVSGSRNSEIRKLVEYITSGSRLVQVLSTASIEDFTYDYERHIRPRYVGSQATSTNYNFFSSNDIDFQTNGVGSFGKNASIDKNTIQFGYFIEAVATGSQLIAAPERTNLYLRYLINDSGSLTELTRRNYENISNNQLYNLYQVQNIYKSGEVLNVGLFDNQSPSIQKTLDGNKIIWSGGYRYYPTLWRVAPVDLYYNVPQGIPAASVPYLQNVNYRTQNVSTRVLVHWGWSELSVSGQVQYIGAGTLPYDVEITLRLHYYNGFTNVTSTITTVMSRLTSTGAPGNNITTFRHDRGYFVGLTYQFTEILNVRPYNATDPSFYYDIVDGSPNLVINSADKRIVSCSAVMSQQGVYPFFFSGSEVPPDTASLTASLNLFNTYCPPDYPFFLVPGDIVRFDGNKTGSVATLEFKEDTEYVIQEVNITGSRYTFTLDRPVDDAVTSSTPFQIERYVFSRKVEDETNVVILHRKQPGQTSGGIVKNINLELGIDDKVADIVSNLKSRIFSTVLVQ